jgi:PIN domain nuclease of toxin-antitoxin system
VNAILLDSHTLLWALHDPTRLTPGARDAISDPRRAVFCSAASAWELEIKAMKSRLTLPPTWLKTAVSTGFIEIPVSSADVRLSADLPPHHRNPFDRLLIAQALSRGLHLATRDTGMGAYDVPLLLA